MESTARIRNPRGDQGRDECNERGHSIAYTYAEPTIFFEYAYDTARLAHEAGLANIYVTNGYMAEEMLEAFHPYLDAADVDLKAFRDETYRWRGDGWFVSWGRSMTPRSAVRRTIWPECGPTPLGMGEGQNEGPDRSGPSHPDGVQRKEVLYESRLSKEV